jgi:hypothetical protein
MSSANDTHPKGRRWVGFFVGVVAGAAVALGLYLLARFVQPGTGLILISVLLIPAAACALAVIAAGLRKGESDAAVVLSAWVVTALFFGSAVIFREGAICIAMAAPLFYPIGMLGGVATAALRGSKPNGAPPALAIVLLPALLLPFEQQRLYPEATTSVVTSVEIAAPFDVVWREAIEIRDIEPKEQSWTITHNVLRVPRPVDASLITREGSLTRRATWEGGIHFNENVTDWREHKHVEWAFDIPEASANRLLDEHLRLDEGYLRLEGGAYDLEALSPTRTRLTLTTRYMVRTPFNAYANAWGTLLLGDIHSNVLQIVRRRAEGASVTPSP